jgi:hypothetical protein
LEVLSELPDSGSRSLPSPVPSQHLA